MAHHNTVLAQILKMLPRHGFEKLANDHDGRRRSDALSRWSQFVALCVGHLGGRTSLRDIEASLKAQSQHRYHLASQPISRSALGRANESLDYRFYEGLFTSLYQRCTQYAPRHGFRFKGKLFSLDGSLIALSMKVFPWADYNRKKAAFKLHVGLDHDGLIPAFAALTMGKDSEMAQARLWRFPKGSVVVFDKGYNSYAWHNSLTQKVLSGLRGLEAMRFIGSLSGEKLHRTRPSPATRRLSTRAKGPEKRICRPFAASAIETRKQASTTSLLPINSGGRRRPSPIFTSSAGRSNYSLNGLSRT